MDICNCRNGFSLVEEASLSEFECSGGTVIDLYAAHCIMYVPVSNGLILPYVAWCVT